jgi:hypothetical protein
MKVERRSLDIHSEDLQIGRQWRIGSMFNPSCYGNVRRGCRSSWGIPPWLDPELDDHAISANQHPPVLGFILRPPSRNCGINRVAPLLQESLGYAEPTWQTA